MPKIYTKTGDEGETSLLGGKRIGKCCIEMEVMGELDELNAVLGVALTKMKVESDEEKKALAEFIKNIQRNLFKIGSEIAGLQTPLNNKIEKIGEDKILELESKIDELWVQLPELENFILPGGGLMGAHFHQARTVCRRTERQLVAFGKTAQIRSELYKYLNRLSDFLFTAARWVNFKEGITEEKI